MGKLTAEQNSDDLANETVKEEWADLQVVVRFISRLRTVTILNTFCEKIDLTLFDIGLSLFSTQDIFRRVRMRTYDCVT